MILAISTNLLAVSAEEESALTVLYNSTNGDNWKWNSGWKRPPLDLDGFAMPGTEGTWFGVTVVSDTVVGIDMFMDKDEAGVPSCNLNGVIPPEIGNLLNLVYLNLRKNLLTSIPPEIGNLINLTEFDVGWNQLTIEF